MLSSRTAPCHPCGHECLPWCRGRSPPVPPYSPSHALSLPYLQEATTRRELDFKRMLPSETLDAHKGTIKAVIQFNERIVTGGSDGLVHVWRHWDELRHEYMRTASMRQTKSMLTEIGVDLKATSMFAHGDDDEDSNHKSFISRGGRPQTCEWQLHQVMDHGSAITAMVQAMLEVRQWRRHCPHSDAPSSWFGAH